MKTKEKLTILVTGLALTGGALWAAWYFMQRIPAGWLALWALIVTLLTPGIFALGFWFGKTEVRGWLAGVDQGLDRVSKAAAQSINNGRAAAAQNQPFVVLPELPRITHRVSESSEIIDL